MYKQLQPLAMHIRKLRKVDEILARHGVTPDKNYGSTLMTESTPYYDFTCQSQCARGKLRLVWGVRFVNRPNCMQGVFMELFREDVQDPHKTEVEVYSHDGKGGWAAGSLVRHRHSWKLLNTIPDTKGCSIPEQHAFAVIDRIVAYFVRHGRTSSPHPPRRRQKKH